MKYAALEAFLKLTSIPDTLSSPIIPPINSEISNREVAVKHSSIFYSALFFAFFEYGRKRLFFFRVSPSWCVRLSRNGSFPIHVGVSVFLSIISRRLGRSCLVTKVKAFPFLPIRPARPVRWVYRSLPSGKSQFTTCETCEKSSPLPATSLAMR